MSFGGPCSPITHISLCTNKVFKGPHGPIICISLCINIGLCSPIICSSLVLILSFEYPCSPITLTCIYNVLPWPMQSYNTYFTCTNNVLLKVHAVPIYLVFTYINNVRRRPTLSQVPGGVSELSVSSACGSEHLTPDKSFAHSNLNF